MNLTTEHNGRISIVRVGEPRLMYPILSDFSSAITSLVSEGKNDILIDLTPVTYVDSATIGCLMDLYRQVHGAGGRLKLSGDLLAVMEALYREVTAKREFERSFEDMVREIQHLIEQMDDNERRTYLAESLFLNTVKYENDKLEAYMRKLTKK